MKRAIAIALAVMMLAAPALATHLDANESTRTSANTSINDLIGNRDGMDEEFSSVFIERLMNDERELESFIEENDVSSELELERALRLRYDPTADEIDRIVALADQEMFSDDGSGEFQGVTAFETDEQTVLVNGEEFTLEELREDEVALQRFSKELRNEAALRDFVRDFDIRTENELESMLILELNLEEGEREEILAGADEDMFVIGTFGTNTRTTARQTALDAPGAQGVDIDGDGVREIVVVMDGQETRPATEEEIEAIDAGLGGGEDVLGQQRTAREENAVDDFTGTQARARTGNDEAATSRNSSATDQ